jgi:hypothetical protein
MKCNDHANPVDATRKRLIAGVSSLGGEADGESRRATTHFNVASGTASAQRRTRKVSMASTQA